MSHMTSIQQDQTFETWKDFNHLHKHKTIVWSRAFMSF